LAKCSICGREAFYYRQYSGHNLCPRCLERMLSKAVRRRIARLALGRRITVAVPLYRHDPWGSLVAARIVGRIEKKFESKVVLLTPDDYSRALADMEIDGVEVVEARVPLSNVDSLVHCIRHERAWAIKEALNHGTTVLVDSVNRDQMVLAALEALLQGRPEGVSEALPLLEVRGLRIVHAFANVEAEAVTALAYALGYTLLEPKCKAHSLAKRVYLRVARGRPELLFSSVKVFSKLSESAPAERCIVCGGYGGPVCVYCRESGASRLLDFYERE